MQELKSRIVKMYCDKCETIILTHDLDSFRRLKENSRHFFDITNAAVDDCMCLNDLRDRLSKSQSLSPRESTLIEVFSYLLFAEGIICTLLNFISYLLVITGHDLYSLTKRKYIADFLKEIEKVEMSTKIQFLNYHGFSVLTKEYDSTFRNDIAHHNYEVDEEGILRIRGKSANLAMKRDALSKIGRFVVDAMTEMQQKAQTLVTRARIMNKKALKT